MFNAVTLRHHLLTLYGSNANDTIRINDANAFPGLVVEVDDLQPMFIPSARVDRIRIFAFEGDDQINIGDPKLLSVRDIYVDCGDGNDTFSDDSYPHPFNRREHISVVGGAGNDTLIGGAHTVLMDGGAGDDVLHGGADGAILDGGDGNDIVSAENTRLDYSLIHPSEQHNAFGSLSLNGGAGDDVIIGNSYKLANATDTLSGGDGNDSFFPFGTDQITDFGQGLDRQLSGNQFVGNADLTQTATLSLNYGAVGVLPFSPPYGLGDNGPKSSIYVSDSSGTLTMQGPSGSRFLLGDLLNAAGYPLDKLGIPTGVTLTVNGFLSPLTGSQIAGYQINNGDMLQLDLLHAA